MRACPACGRDNAEDARFCQYCATPLETTPEHEQRKVVTVVFTDVAATHDDDDTHSIAGQARSVLATLRGDHARAVAEAEGAIRLAREREAGWNEGLALTTLADALEAAGDAAGALRALEEALDRFERKGIVPLIERTKARLESVGEGSSPT